MSEIGELKKDLIEQMRFLQELGVDSLRVELPDDDLRLEHPTEIVHSDFQTYVPSDDELKIPEQPQPARTAAASGNRGDILNNIRLSGRDPADAPAAKAEGTAADRIRKEIVEKKEVTPSEEMFGDLTPGLPDSAETLGDIRKDIGGDCTRCRLCEKRTQVVNSVGDTRARLMFIGEAPGADEDAQGEPFVGRAGQLLTKIIEAIDLKREDVFIGNINRCRPPDNRRPMPDEAEVCKPFLIREIGVVRPEVIVVLGNTACQNLLDTKTGITKLRGKFLTYFGVKVMPTFHPAYLLRDPRKKREVWEDMKLVREALRESE